MRRLAVVVLAIAACVPVRLATSATGAAPGFDYGVAAGEITSSSAVIWTRAPKAGRLTYEVDRVEVPCKPAKDGGSGLTSGLRCSEFVFGSSRVESVHDLTVRVRVPRLRPATRYRYHFEQGGATSAIGTFVTAPKPTANAAIRFAFSGDADATPGPDGKPGFNIFQVYGRMATEKNDFNINLGDTIYSDSEVAGSPAALHRRREVGEVQARPGASEPRASSARGAGLYSHWDDHEFVNDFSRAEYRRRALPGGRQGVHRLRAGHVARPKNGLYRTFRWGKNLELFFLDERSFRSAKASAGGTCNVRARRPRADRARGRARRLRGARSPRSASPVSQACLDAINEPVTDDSSARGSTPRSSRRSRPRPRRGRSSSNETPIQQFYRCPYDRWEGYAAERTQLLARPRGRQERRLPDDRHAREPDRRGAAADVRAARARGHRHLGGRHRPGRDEHVREGDRRRHRPARDAVTSSRRSFLKPPPPRGIGHALRRHRRLQLQRGSRDRDDA